MASEITVKTEADFEALSPAIQQATGQVAEILPRISFPKTYDAAKHEVGKKAYLDADSILAEINRAIKEIEERRKKLTVPLDEVKAQIMNAARLKLDPLTALKNQIRASMSTFAMEEDRWATEEKRRKEDEERKRKEDERLAMAETVAKAGNAKAADELLEAPVPVRKVEVATANDEAKSSRRKVWNVEIVDPKAFVAAWLEGKVPSGSVSIDGAMLKRVAAAQNGEVAWPGVRVFQEIVIGSGR